MTGWDDEWAQTAAAAGGVPPGGMSGSAGDDTPGAWPEEADALLPDADWAASSDRPSPVSGDGPIRLDTCPDARALRAALLAAQPLADARLDASQVARLPLPAIQVLLAAVHEAGAAGGRLTVLDPSFAFTLAFEALGLGGDDEPFNVEYS
jgi:anti-anti-sigma regulatory factor